MEKSQLAKQNPDTQSHPLELVRVLGFKEALTIGLGMMIGAGNFVFSTIAARYVGRKGDTAYGSMARRERQ